MGISYSGPEEYIKEGKEEVKKIRTLVKPLNSQITIVMPTKVVGLEVFGEPAELFLNSLKQFEELKPEIMQFKTGLYTMSIGLRRMIGDCNIHNKSLADSTISTTAALKILSSVHGNCEDVAQKMEHLCMQAQNMKISLEQLEFEENFRELQDSIQEKLEELENSNDRVDAHRNAFNAGIFALLKFLGLGFEQNTDAIQKLKSLTCKVVDLKNQITNSIDLLIPLFQKFKTLLAMQRDSFQALQRDIQRCLTNNPWKYDWELFYSRLLYVWKPICYTFIKKLE